MKAVLFDMDGVLIDSEIFYMNGTYDWISKKGFKGTISDVYRLLGTTLDETYNLIYELLEGKYTKEQIKNFNEEYFSNNPVDYKSIVKDGVYELLEYLKSNNIKTALCSSSPMFNIKHVLEQTNTINYFDYIISGDDLDESKPNPQIYLLASKALRVSIFDCIVIEDSTLGIEAGKRANMEVIAINDKRFSQNQSKADYMVDNLFGAKKIIENKINC